MNTSTSSPHAPDAAGAIPPNVTFFVHPPDAPSARQPSPGGAREAVDDAARAVFGAAMTTTTTNPERASARAFALPNMLTYARIAAVPVVVACMYGQSVLDYGLWLRWVALFVFIAAGITDVLDGYAARAYGQQSSFGRMLGEPAAKEAFGAFMERRKPDFSKL